MEQLNDTSHLATQVQRLTKCSGTLAHLYARYNTPVLADEQSNMLYVKIPTPQGEVVVIESATINEFWLCYEGKSIKSCFTADQLVDFIEQLGGKAYECEITQEMEQRFKERLDEEAATSMAQRYSSRRRARA